MTFSVIDTTTGAYPDLWKIALEEEWAKRLCYCDMEGFAIEEDGTLVLMDECGMCAYPPDPDRFKVVVPCGGTNADKIRVMTDEELADWLGVYCNGQTAQEVGKPCVSGMGSCEECWLDWLKQEAEI